MKLSDLLAHLRTHHLEGMAALLAPLVARGRVLTETVALSDEGDVLPTGVLALPMRIDVVVLQESGPPKRAQLDTRKMLSFPTAEFTWPTGPQVKLGPFPWDALEVRLGGLGDAPEWGPLRQWFLGCFGDKTVVGDGGEPCGVVHHLGDPVREGEDWVFAVDLGSAPVVVFESLVNALAAMGASRVELGAAHG